MVLLQGDADKVCHSLLRTAELFEFFEIGCLGNWQLVVKCLWLVNGSSKDA